MRRVQYWYTRSLSSSLHRMPVAQVMAGARSCICQQVSGRTSAMGHQDGTATSQAARLADSAKKCKQRSSATSLVLDMRGPQPRDKTRSPATTRGATHSQGRACRTEALLSQACLAAAYCNAGPPAECRVVKQGLGSRTGIRGGAQLGLRGGELLHRAVPLAVEPHDQVGARAVRLQEAHEPAEHLVAHLPQADRPVTCAPPRQPLPSQARGLLSARIASISRARMHGARRASDSTCADRSKSALLYRPAE